MLRDSQAAAGLRGLEPFSASAHLLNPEGFAIPRVAGQAISLQLETN